MRVFVTVGTTQFDALIVELNKPSTLEALAKHNCTELIVQRGRGHVMLDTSVHIPNMNRKCFRFAADLHPFISEADLVISHAGAGSILETLRAARPLLVVVNQSLQGNHQTELARALAEDNFLAWTTCSHLTDAIDKGSWKNLSVYPQPDVKAFTRLLDEEMEGCRLKDKDKDKDT